MSKIKWHSGPPPSVGWWPASAVCNPAIFRWWDGVLWSIVALDGDTVEEAAYYAAIKDTLSHIKWTDRPESWPEQSRT